MLRNLLQTEMIFHWPRFEGSPLIYSLFLLYFIYDILNYSKSNYKNGSQKKYVTKPSIHKVVINKCNSEIVKVAFAMLRAFEDSNPFLRPR